MEKTVGLTTDIDYLVYSSHKTGTQSLVATLRASSLRAQHLHILRNKGMQSGEGEFSRFIDNYKQENGHDLTIISTFRLPIERHISSFFQWHGSGVIRTGKCKGEEDTIIAKYSVTKLQQIFTDELTNRTLVGIEESINELTNELGIDIRDAAHPQNNFLEIRGNNQPRIVMFRFDRLFACYPGTLETAIKRSLLPVTTNVSAEKWYKEKFRSFVAETKLPKRLIETAFQERRELIELFYPDQFERLLETSIERYSR